MDNITTNFLENNNLTLAQFMQIVEDVNAEIDKKRETEQKIIDYMDNNPGISRLTAALQINRKY